MISKLLTILGYSGSDPIVEYLVVMAALILAVCLAYRFTDFIMSFVSGLINRNNKISF